MAEGPARNLAVDFYRVSGVVLIVLGHWLAGSVTYHDGHFGRQNPLVDLPWTQWLTWPFQAVPTFFLVAGYAGAVSWTHRRDTEGVSRQTWVRHRLARVLGPDNGLRRAGVGSCGRRWTCATLRVPHWNMRVGRWRCTYGSSPCIWWWFR